MMAPSPEEVSRVKKVVALSARLYNILLYAYPATFRRAYGERQLRVFRDTCRATLQQRGELALFSLWIHILPDLFFTVCLEHWQHLKEKKCFMVQVNSTQNFPARLWIALTATLLAFLVSLVASLNLYLLEDANPLTQAAYSASSLLRFSYDGVYLSALAAGVAVVGIVGYMLVKRTMFVAGGLVAMALLIAFGGFGGLLVRHPLNFLVFFVAFLALTLGSFLFGRLIALRLARLLESRPAAVLGACVGVGSVLLVNIVALVLHTLSLNLVSHQLYMQGQIGGTHWNFTLIAMVLAFLTLLVCAICLGCALRLPSRHA